MVNAFERSRPAEPIPETKQPAKKLKIVKEEGAEILGEYEAAPLIAKAKEHRHAPRKFGELRAERNLPPLPGQSEPAKAAAAEILSEHTAAPLIKAARKHAAERTAPRFAKLKTGRAIPPPLPERDGIEVEKEFDQETLKKISEAEPIFEDINKAEAADAYNNRAQEYTARAEHYLSLIEAQRTTNPYAAKAAEYAWRKAQSLSMQANRLARRYQQWAAYDQIPDESLEKAKLTMELETGTLVNAFQEQVLIFEQAEQEVASEIAIPQQLEKEKQTARSEIAILREQEKGLQRELDAVELQSFKLANSIFAALRREKAATLEAQAEIKLAELQKVREGLNSLIEKLNEILPPEERLVSPQTMEKIKGEETRESFGKGSAEAREKKLRRAKEEKRAGRFKGAAPSSSIRL